MTTETKPQPCPFCGGVPELWTYTNCPNAHIYCTECDVKGPELDSDFEAIEAWNSVVKRGEE